MGVRVASFATTSPTATNIPNGSEAVVFTSGPLGLDQDNALVLIQWYIHHSPGAGATNITFRIRRGTSTGGTLVNVAANTAVVASAGNILSGSYLDTPGVSAGLQYVLTAQSTGNISTVNDGCIAVMVL